MSKLKRAASSLACLLCVAITRDARAQSTITVDPAKVTRTLPATFHGMNFVGFWDAEQGSAASAQALAETGVKLIRFPGGDPGDFYDWACPYYFDKPAATCPPAPVAASWSRTSPLELWNYTKTLGAGATILFQTNLVHFSKDNVRVNTPGKTYVPSAPESVGDWAKQNVTQGIGAMFEIGNEEDMTDKPTNYNYDKAHFASSYIAPFKAQAQAIHAVSKAIQVVGPAGTNEFYWWNQKSLVDFLAAVGNKQGTGETDGISLHFYRGTNWADSIDTAQYWLKAGGPWEFIHQTIGAYDDRQLPVYITEWHLGPANVAWTSSMANALVGADLIGAFAQSGVAGYLYFCLHGIGASSLYGVLYGSGDSRPTDSPSPAYYGLALWGRMGNSVVGLTQTANPSTTVSAYATTKADGSVQVMAINKSATMQMLNVTSGVDPAKGVSIYTLSPEANGQNGTDAMYNGVKNPDYKAGLPAPAREALTGPSLSYGLAAYSIVVFDFGGDGTTPPTTGAGSTGAGGGASTTGMGGVATATATGTGMGSGTGTGMGGAEAGAPSATGKGCGCRSSGTLDGRWLSFGGAAFLFLAIGRRVARPRTSRDGVKA